MSSSSSSEPVFLFPGQGGYLPGGLSRVCADRSLPAVVGQVDAISLRYGGPTISTLLESADAPTLDMLLASDVPALSLAIFATELAVLDLARELAGVTPGLVIGHSFGEFAALTAAGALGLADGVRLVIARDRALRASPDAEGGMVALRVGRQRANAVVGSLADRGLAVAAHNGYDQVVVSGPHESLDRLTALAGLLGIEATRLRVPYPFHNRLLAAANRLFEAEVAEVRVRAPRVPMYSPVLGRYVETEQDSREILTSHLEREVGFMPALVSVRGDGYTHFLECGARAALTDLVSACLPGVQTAAPLRQRRTLDELRGAFATSSSSEAGSNGSSVAQTGSNGSSIATTGSNGAPVASARADAAPVEPARLGTQQVAVPTAAVPATAPAPAEPAPSAGADVPGLVDELRTLYASAVGYPEEVFEADIELEADLGIDSIRQTELLQRARQKYDLPEADIRITDYTTLESIAELLTQLGAGRVKA
ncbi:acyltransferase domain-containing protein [Lentzea sp. DG1S-22]|uniref:acyltransferase domain-containing protein n=1 Tax=Lentzea sp. DG1S-22 TaxID=3108822 RepID=UPI002E7A28EE|nr:acyltransferase domain-containing protein [Lentzea sp. DG1S-22]WVH83417.1 acyltransferase domain-containing protein [Lentzea sp. DG1S-22]